MIRFSRLAAALLCLAAGHRATAQFSLSATGGLAAATYPSLAATFNAINSGTHTGDITILVTASSNEGTAECVLNPSGVTVGATTASYSSVLLKPAPGTSPTIESQSAVAVIRLNGADNVTIDGSNTAGGTTRDLTLSNAFNTTAANAVVWLKPYAAGDGASNNVIKNCRIQGYHINYYYTAAAIACGNAISVYTSSITQNNLAANSGNTIRNNELRYAQTGILLTGYNASPYDNGNTIEDNFLGNLTWRGIYASYQASLTVSRNTISRVVMEDATHAVGVYLFQTASGLVQANRISTILNLNAASTFGAAGIYLAANLPVQNVTLSNNFIRSVGANNSQGFSTTANASGIVLSTSNGTKLYHNTISMDTVLNAGANTAALLLSAGAASVSARNNIFANRNANAGTRYAVYSAGSALGGNHNDYNSTGALGYIGGSARSNLAAWRTATGGDAASIDSLPVFASLTDLHLAGGSANSGLRGRGTYLVAVPGDIDGDLRSNPPAIGADEVATPLPIRLIQLQAAAEREGNRVCWTWVATEGATRFRLQRSSNARDFETISELALGGGSYSLLDRTAPAADCWYRLQLEDGSYSALARVGVAAERTIALWPNPVRGGRLGLRLPLQAGRLRVYGAGGNLLLDRPTEGGPEFLETEGWVPGSYQLQYLPQQGTPVTRQILR